MLLHVYTESDVRAGQVVQRVGGKIEGKRRLAIEQKLRGDDADFGWDEC